MSKGNNKKKKVNNSKSNKVKYYASPVILSETQKKDLGASTSDLKDTKKVEGGLESLSVEELKAKKICNVA